MHMTHQEAKVGTANHAPCAMTPVDILTADERRALVDVMAHELRTPLTSIYGVTQMLIGDLLASDVRTSVLRDLALDAERLRATVEDLVAIEHLATGTTCPDPEPVLLQHLAADVGRAEERRHAGRRIVVTYPAELPAALADEGLTSHALRDLVVEALEASSREHQVEIRLSATETEVAVAVCDRGSWFPAGLDDGAFRLFPQELTTVRSASTTGLRLLVARVLVEAQDGRVWLRRRVRGGTEIGLALPRAGSADVS